jgi:uncharacterized protein (DUF885 family)
MRDLPAPQGDRNKLSAHELQILDDQVLPTARRWITDFPALAQHARQTLAFWGEPIPEPKK